MVTELAVTPTPVAPELGAAPAPLTSADPSPTVPLPVPAGSGLAPAVAAPAASPFVPAAVDDCPLVAEPRPPALTPLVNPPRGVDTEHPATSSSAMSTTHRYMSVSQPFLSVHMRA